MLKTSGSFAIQATLRPADAAFILVPRRPLGVRLTSGAALLLAAGGGLGLLMGGHASVHAADLIIEGSNSPYVYNGGGITYGNIYVGYQSDGELDITGGTLRSTTLILGAGAGTLGTVLMAPPVPFPSSLETGDQIIGQSGNGYFAQAGLSKNIAGTVTLALNPGSNGIYSLRGIFADGRDERAQLIAARVTGGQGNSQFEFSGGVLKPTMSDNPNAASNPTTFFAGLGQAYVRNEGAIIDSNGFNITVAQPLLHSALAGDRAIDGGLTKRGAGTLTLTGGNTYTGGTFVTAGTLTVGGSGNFGATSGGLTSSGGTLDLAGRSFTFGGITLAGGTIQNGTVTGSSLAGQSGVVSATLAGSGVALTKTTGGTLTLTGANTYTGGTQINAGILQFGKTLSMPGSGTVTVASGAVLAVNVGGAGEFTTATSGAGSIGGLLAGIGGQSAPVVFNSGSYLGFDPTNAPGSSSAYSGIISNSNGVAKLGGGTFTLSGANTYTGGTLILGGTLSLGGAGTLGASTSPLSVNSGTLDLGGTTQQVGAVTSNGGSIRNGTLRASGFTFETGNSSVSAILADKTGLNAPLVVNAGTATLTGANTYTGGTTINGGTLLLGGAGTLGNTAGSLAVRGGTLDLGGTTQRAGAVNFLAGTNITNGSLIASSFNLSRGNFEFNLSVSANLGGTGAVLTIGNDFETFNQVTLSGNNTYTGGTRINGGSLVPQGANALGSGPITFGGGTLELNGGFPDPSSRIANSTAPIRLVATDMILASPLASSNTGGLTLFGKLTLSAPNAFSGPITINGQGQPGGTTLTIAGNGTLGNPANSLHIQRENSTLDLGGTTQTVGAVSLLDPTAADLTQSGGGRIVNGKLIASSFEAYAGTVTADLTVNGRIDKDQGTIDALQVLTFSGSQISTGPVGAKGGLQNLGGLIEFSNGARLDLDSLANGGVNTASYSVDGETLVGRGIVITPTLAISGANTALSLGNLSVGVNQTGIVQQNDGTVTATQIFFGPGGSYNLDGGVLKTGGINGNAIGNGTGVFNFNGGTLQASGASANFLANVGTAQVRNGGVKFDTNNFSVTVSEPLIHSTIGGDAAIDGGLTKLGAGTLTLSGANTYTGATAINAGTLQFAKANALPAGGPVSVASGAVLVVNAGGAGEFNGNTAGAGSLGGLLGGSGGQGALATFAAGAFFGIDTTNATGGAFTYGGAIGNSNGGANALGLLKLGSGKLTLTGANTYTGGTTITDGTLQLGDGTNNNGSILGNVVNNGTLAFANPSAQTFAGVISGSGGFTKSGAGTLTFSGASPNTYAGDTLVNAGTLVLAKTNVGAPANFGSAMGGGLVISTARPCATAPTARCATTRASSTPARWT